MGGKQKHAAAAKGRFFLTVIATHTRIMRASWLTRVCVWARYRPVETAPDMSFSVAFFVWNFFLHLSVISSAGDAFLISSLVVQCRGKGHRRRYRPPHGAHGRWQMAAHGHGHGHRSSCARPSSHSSPMQVCHSLKGILK
jgi:hypothetical protein